MPKNTIAGGQAKRLEAYQPRKRALPFIEQFLFDRTRIKNVLQRFYERALLDDRVLVKYMEYVLPRQEQQGNSTTIIFNSSISSKALKKKYDLDGNVIEAEELPPPADPPTPPPSVKR